MDENWNFKDLESEECWMRIFVYNGKMCIIWSWKLKFIMEIYMIEGMYRRELREV